MTSNDKLKFVSQRLNLPLFMVSRNRFREDVPRKVPTYIAKKRNFLTDRCNEENAEDTKTTRYFKHLIGLYPPCRSECLNARSTKTTRAQPEVKSWQLPPNLYDTTKVPFQAKGGMSGAYWRKQHVVKGKTATTVPKKSTTHKAQWKFYNIVRETERMTTSCHKHKGVFLSNARKHRATARCMVIDTTMVYRDPYEPSPANYYPHRHELSYKLKPAKRRELHNPHIFLRNSCVASNETSIIRRHMSFEPAVGRYEVRFPKICPCPGRKEYQPGLQLLIEQEKRLKFRRQPHKKFKLRKHCSPDWEHVIGHGFRRLFRQPPSLRKPPVKPSKDAKKTDKTLQLYPDARYIAMINQPGREALSIRTEPIKLRPPKVRYNCLAKRHIRRQLRHNKKIVFNSGQERFPDSEWRVVQLTTTQLENLKASLPIERQLRDHPITRRSLSKIKPLLYEPTERMKPAFELALRKRLFKFLPLPGPKVLVTEADLVPSLPDGAPYEPTGFFNKPLDPTKFMLNDAPKQLQENATDINAQTSIDDAADGTTNVQAPETNQQTTEPNAEANVTAAT